jgi:hypothetical protein
MSIVDLDEDTIKEMIAASQALEQEMAEKIGGPGWVYRDIPWSNQEVFEGFMKVVGVDNIKLIALSTRKIEEKTYVRGQAVISPEGMANMLAYHKANMLAYHKEHNNEV